jgi:hypothetical protein
MSAMDDLVQALGWYDAWAAEGTRLGTLEGETGEFDADAWHAHDDDGADLAHALARTIREVLTLPKPEHTFAPAVGDPGHCAICGEYDSDHPVHQD